jgi:hypothetical protein
LQGSIAEAMAPFCIDTMETRFSDGVRGEQNGFAIHKALLFEDVFAASLFQSLMAQAAAAPFVHNDVEHVGTREIEQPQRVGKLISLLLARPEMLRWLERVTEVRPLRAVSGQLAQTRANGSDELVWHDDLSDLTRKLAVVINLSSEDFKGGLFELRRKGSKEVLVSQKYHKPGSMMIFAVEPGLEHHVTPLLSGGPRRVYAGWYLSEPEHADQYSKSGSIA